MACASSNSPRSHAAGRGGGSLPARAGRRRGGAHELGAALVSLGVRIDGRPGHVALGFDALEPYLGDQPHFGATVGRYANRIAGARFRLARREIRLSANEKGNHLHGGERGFSRRVWRSEAFETQAGVGVRFQYRSADGEEGYPGSLDVAVVYTLGPGGELRIDYRASSDRTTVVNLTTTATSTCGTRAPAESCHTGSRSRRTPIWPWTGRAFRPASFGRSRRHPRLPPSLRAGLADRVAGAGTRRLRPLLRAARARRGGRAESAARLVRPESGRGRARALDHPARSPALHGELPRRHVHRAAAAPPTAVGRPCASSLRTSPTPRISPASPRRRSSRAGSMRTARSSASARESCPRPRSKGSSGRGSAFSSSTAWRKDGAGRQGAASGAALRLPDARDGYLGLRGLRGAAGRGGSELRARPGRGFLFRWCGGGGAAAARNLAGAHAASWPGPR